MISNASPLIIFASVNRLDLLIKVHQKIRITSAVYEEVTRKKEKPDASVIADAVANGLVFVENFRDNTKVSELQRHYSALDHGEATTIALALCKREKEVLIDDRIARIAAKLHGLIPRGSLSVLFEAYKKKIINENDLQGIIRDMTSAKFRLSAHVLLAFWEGLRKSSS